MKKIQPKSYKKSKKLICDWTNKKKYLIHRRMLKFYVRHGMVVGKKFMKLIRLNKVNSWENI